VYSADFLFSFYSISDNKTIVCMISGFRLEVDEIFAFLGYYAVYGGNSLLTFRDNISVPSSTVKKSVFLALEDGTNMLSRNVGKNCHFRLRNIPE
jgi:hypothetical protein